MNQHRKRSILIRIAMFALLSVFAFPAMAKADEVYILQESGEQTFAVKQASSGTDADETAGPLGSTARKEDDEGLTPTATPTPTPAPTPSQWDVCMGKGEAALYDEHGELFGKLAITNDNDYIAGFIPDASSNLAEGIVSVRFRPTETVLLDQIARGETNEDMTPVWVEYSESSKRMLSFRAWLDPQIIRNFNELVVAFQSVMEPQGQEHEPDRNEPLPMDEIDVSERPSATAAPTAPLYSADTVDEVNEQRLGLWEIIKIVLLGISVLLGALSLLLGQLRERTNMESVNRLSVNYSSLANTTKELARNTVSNQSLADIKTQIEAIQAFLARVVPGPSLATAPIPNPVADFLSVVNAQTGVSARQVWYNSLAQHYSVEFVQYDAINGRFFLAKDELNPPFAICSVLNEVFLIPSCYDTALQAVDLPMIYDIVTAARPASTYRIDKAAKLQPYGAYYTVETKGHITLLS